ncbi:GNAT family N-acetyltransferase [Streptococcus ovis]|uniref:GNAT family N-acetyltransferase n=1 Tax=Streptococcus ovis TaxID=82806 RepID=UPI000374A9F8|nr:GNAT family protein [Streptococcus ovis]
MNLFGTPVLESQHLLLRPYVLEDAQHMFENWASRSENITYVTWYAHENIDFTRQLLTEWVASYDKPDFLHWVIALKEQPDFVIGDISVIAMNQSAQSCELGYILSQDYWGQGLMTEALKTVIAFLFEQVHCNRITAIHATENPASGRVMEKAGMKCEGTFRQAVNLKGRLVDVSEYAILKEEFTKKQKD